MAVSPRCGAAATLAILAGALSTGAPALAADVTWNLRLALDERYDDNIIQLSDRDINRLENPPPQQAASNLAAKRFAIETAGDFVSIPRLSSGLRVAWLAGAPTAFDLDLADYRYQENPIKNYRFYRISASQPLHGGKAHATLLRLSNAVIPSFYLRNLISDRAVEEGVVPLTNPVPRLEATYQKVVTQVEIDQEIAPDRLWLAAIVGDERRNYDRFFDERDSHMPFHEFACVWTPLGSGRVRVHVSYRREDLHAGGDLSDTVTVESDVSSRRDIFTANGRLRWGAKGRREWISLDFEDERRDYVTTNSLSDPFHFNRFDRRRYATLAYHADLRKGWFLTAQAERDTNRSRFGSQTGLSSDPNDTTDYTENLVQVGFGYAFGLGERERQPEGPSRPW